MRDLDELRIPRPTPATPDDLTALERLLQRPLPSTFRNFVSYADAATPEVSCFESEFVSSAVSEFFSVAPGPYSIASYLGRGPQGVPTDVVPIGRDAADNWIALDFRRDGEPEVVFYEHVSGQTFVIATTFGAFIDGLESGDE
jgi:hypothetical protein